MELGTPLHTTPNLASDNAWIGALAAICVAIILYGVFYSTNTNSNLAYLIGFSLLPTLLLTFLMRVTCLRGRSSQLVLVSFGAIYVSFLLCWSIAAHQQRVEAVAAISSVQAEVARVTAAQPGESPTLSTQPLARGVFGEVERFVLQFLRDLTSMQEAYVAELAAIGWEGVLDPARLRADVGLKRTHTMIQQAKQMVDLYEVRHKQLIQDAGARVAAVEVPADVKRDITAGFAQGLAESKSMTEEQWRLEREIVAEIEAVTLLFQSPDTWEIKGDMILFERDADVDEYNTRMTRFWTLVERQERNATEGLAEFQRQMEGIKQHARR